MPALPPLEQNAQLMDQLTMMYEMQNLLNAYVINNYLLINQAQDAKTETVYNGNLYSLAVKYYGDLTYWTVLANANQATLQAIPDYDFPDPDVPGIVTLLIPPKPSTNISGGVYQISVTT